MAAKWLIHVKSKIYNYKSFENEILQIYFNCLYCIVIQRV